MKIVILTSNSFRHKYIANVLSQNFDLKLIITEKKSQLIEDVSDLEDDDKTFVKNHFEQREKKNELFLMTISSFQKFHLYKLTMEKLIANLFLKK